MSPESANNELLAAFRRYTLALLGGWLRWGRRSKWIREDGRHGLGVYADELEQLFKRSEPAAVEIEQIQPGPADAWALLERSLEAGVVGAGELALRWSALVERLQLEAEERQVLAVLVAMSVDHSLVRALRFAWADFGRLSMPLGFALRLVHGGERLLQAPEIVTDSKLLRGNSALLTHFLVRLRREQLDAPRTEIGLSLFDETLRFLVGRDWIPHEYSLPLEERLPQRFAELVESASRRLRELSHDKQLQLSVYGPPGSGRALFATHLLRGLPRPAALYTLELNQAVESGHGIEVIERAIRLATLFDASLVIRGLDEIPKSHQERWITLCQQRLRESRLCTVWLLDEQPPAALELNPLAVVPLTYPSRIERQQCWADEVGGLGLSEQDTFALAGRFLITEGQIRATVREASAAVALDPAAEISAELESVARREAAVGLGRLATPETKHVDLSQLIVDEETRTLLHEIISYTANREELAASWGFDRMLPYGLGVTALFAGPPGTGKTLAANAISSALGLELFRVDLSQLVSKYIGETEKHLSTLFNAASNGEVMLLFDEADSLFSKRTEVKSSVDRYANLEVNYLLQRIERFDGVVILTTNFEAGIDDAFARRIRFRVSFPAPDQESRARLWRILTPSDVPLDSDVDFDIMAEDYELSGGHIKEVVLRAAALALASPNPKVTQDLLIRSAEAEL